MVLYILMEIKLYHYNMVMLVSVQDIIYLYLLTHIKYQWMCLNNAIHLTLDIKR